MRTILVFAALVAVALARPDVSHLLSKSKTKNNQHNGYNRIANHKYSDSASFGTSSSAVTTGSGFDNMYNSAQLPAASNNGYDSSAGSNAYADSSDNSNAGFSGASSSNGFNNGNNGGINLIEGHTQTLDLTGGSNGGQRVVYKPVIKQGEPIITKNFYVHAAPEDEEDVRVEEKVQVVRPQKTYKIIFIKAPTLGSQQSFNYPVYPQNEEKTIVYVLSKKHEDHSDIGEIPTPPPPVTHKPDVFFIKYKTRQEAADAVANIQSQFQSDSQGSTDLSSSSGSESEGSNYNSGLSESDIRIDGNESHDHDNLGGTQDSGIQTFQTLPQTQFGPSGGQIAIETNQFLPNVGALPISDEQDVPQNSYVDTTSNGQSFSSDSTSSSAEFLPQHMVKISAEQSAFRPAYLPPSACSNC